MSSSKLTFAVREKNGEAKVARDRQNLGNVGIKEDNYTFTVLGRATQNILPFTGFVRK
tara:strand:- start:577 stop:750 length:174 start_codon:yes stop_codon:yes gene_type:complete